MTTTDDIIRFLKENKIYLQQHFHCNGIGLFGSFARNEQDEKSDIDILVEFEPGTQNLYDLEDELKDYLKKHLEREIDLCSKKWIKPIFRQLVLNDTIYA